MRAQGKTAEWGLRAASKKVLCVALAGAVATGFSFAMMNAAPVRADALTYTGFLTMKQFDGNHVAYLGQTTETCAFTGSGVAPSKVTISNKKVAVTPYNGPSELYIDFKKVGTTTITYYVKGKKHTAKWTIKKFTNPFATFKTGTTNLKKYGKKAYFNGTITGRGASKIYTGATKDFVYQDGTAQGASLPEGLQVGKKLIVKASSGWKIYGLYADTKAIKSGATIAKGTGTVSVLMQNKKDKTIVHYTITNNDEWG